MPITHAFVSPKGDGGDTTLLRPSNWNASHVWTWTVEFLIDGGGSAITSGIKGDIEMPCAGTITAVTLLADATGSITVDLWKTVYASYPPTVSDKITASAKPTITSALKYRDTTLTGWTKTFAAGDILRVNVDSAATMTRCLLSLTVSA
jgi:hypothetical protein